MKNFFLKCIIFFNCFLAFSSSILAKTVFVDSSQPPPGFEFAQTNQHLRVSVLFMNQYIGFYYVTIHDGQLRFYSPKQLFSHLQNIKNNKNILRLLKKSFPLNIECAENGIAALPHACEQLKRKSIYIIYNPEQETVYLYLSPTYFKKPTKENMLNFIPYPTSRWSYINKLGVAGSFSNEDTIFLSRVYSGLPNYYNLYSNNTLAYKNNSLIANISQNNGINDGQHFQIQNLYAEHITRDKIYTAGYIFNATSPFLQSEVIVGAGMQTTLETVKNAEAIIATPLIIFIPEASPVNIFKNEQLIYSQYLEAGYQRINTVGFPQGGYDLTIKIGANNTIHRFFTKGFFLPPELAPQFYVMGGYLTNGLILDTSFNFLPNVLNIPVLQSGLNKRMSERVALLGDILLTSHQGLLDFGFTFYLGNVFVKTAGLITTKNNYGIYTMLNTQMKRLNFSLIATKIFYQNKNPDNFFLSNLTDNDSTSITYRLSDRSFLGLQGNYNKSLDQPHSYNAGIFYQRQLGNYKDMNFFFNAAYNKAIYVGDSYNLSLTMNFSHGKLAGTESLLWQHQLKNNQDEQLAIPVVLQGSTVYSHQNEQEIGYSVNEIHTISPTVASLASTYNYTAPQGFVATYANYNRTKGERYTVGYGGNLETELAVTQNGMRFNGVRRGNTAGIMVRINTGHADNTSQFALLDENNRKIAVLPANKKVFISIPGFTDQNYTLVNLSKTDYFIREPMRHITLYPGNIGYYEWKVEKRIIVIGHALIKHRPLANTWIHAGKNGIFSDSEGYFQLELSQNTKTLMAEDICKIHLPKLNINKGYLYIGDISCT